MTFSCLSFDLLLHLRWHTCAALLLLISSLTMADPAQDAKDAQRNFNAIQTIYRNGVPHTDKRGQVLMTYDAEKSFFQRAIWGAPLPVEVYGYQYHWEPLVEGGFNTVWPWPSFGEERSLVEAEKFGLQTVLMTRLTPEIAQAVKDNPALLGNCWMDEPLGQWDRQEELLKEFAEYKEAIDTIAPDLPVFINQVPWITEPATSYWVKWNDASDISCHDNYPIRGNSPRTRSIALDPNASIPASVTLGVATGLEQKPVWLIVGAFTDNNSPSGSFVFRFPTPDQLRACVYAGIIHGATGIIYFTMDSFVPRDGGVIGMTPTPQVAWAPNPQAPNHTKPSPATPMQMVQAKACWDASVQINKEIEELTPVILAPTVGNEVKYSLSIKGEAPSMTPLRCILKPHPEGGYVLLTVNCDDALLDVTYTFPQGLSKVETMFDNQNPPALENENKSFKLWYEPFATHVIRILP